MSMNILAAGATGRTGLHLVQHLIDLALESGVKRFVMLSSIGADRTNPTGDMAPYLNAKHEADEYLKASGVTYSILRPVALTNNGRGTDVILGEDVDNRARMCSMCWRRPP
jgi:uncharacterized protein YbjT (DUF2867 family)